jgi:HD superfamily phosphohydrolase
MDDDIIPFSQLAHEAFESNPADHGLGATNFAGSFLSPQQAGYAATSANGNGIVVTHDQLFGKHGKLFNDPIHGAYRLDAACTLIFDTREFQRLRRLKQLGMAYYVFPGASHNRFEHSLGVAHLAYRFATQLWYAQPQELEIDRSDIRVVGLAGLCHDLGHGPFSHVFDREFLRQKGITDWEHEDMSAKMLDHIIDENQIDVFSENDVSRIKKLITSGHEAPPASPEFGSAIAATTATATPSENRWLGEIVANGRNSIDVDKFDYLARDAYYCGTKVACDFNRIMQFSRVIGDEICYKYTEYMNLHELFHARATMHRSVYTHKKSKAIEFMVVDALLEAEPALRLCDKIHHAKDFVLLDDGILDFIENFDVLGPLLNNVDEGHHARIKSAQAIISRLRKRQLYKYVTDALVPVEALERGQWVPPTAQEIVSHYHSNGDVTLSIDDVLVHENKIDYSMSNKNPLDNVHFYDYIGDPNKRKLRPDQISSMVVVAFQEKRIRLYSRNADPKVITALHEAFESWLKYRFGGHVEASTPAKPLRQQHAAEGLTTTTTLALKRGKRNLFGDGGGGGNGVGDRSTKQARGA